MALLNGLVSDVCSFVARGDLSLRKLIGSAGRSSVPSMDIILQFASLHEFLPGRKRLSPCNHKWISQLRSMFL
jgi:hypothetical protein